VCWCSKKESVCCCSDNKFVRWCCKQQVCALVQQEQVNKSSQSARCVGGRCHEEMDDTADGRHGNGGVSGALYPPALQPHSILLLYNTLSSCSTTTFAAQSGTVRKNRTFSNILKHSQTIRGLNLCTSHILGFGSLGGQDVSRCGRIGARGKRKGFSPAAVARHSQSARVHTDSRQKTIFP